MKANKTQNFTESNDDLEEASTPVQAIPFKNIMRKNFEVMRDIKSKSPNISKNEPPLVNKVKYRFGKSVSNNIRGDSYKAIIHKPSIGSSYSDNLENTTGNDHMVRKSIESGVNSNHNLISNNNSNSNQNLTSNNDSVRHINHQSSGLSHRSSRFPTLHTIHGNSSDKHLFNMYDK